MNDAIIKILEASVKKNGDITLSTNHLLNIMKMARDKIANDTVDEVQIDWFD